jgi:thiol-disulfide isomerase/thioredoxin
MQCTEGNSRYRQSTQAKRSVTMVLLPFYWIALYASCCVSSSGSVAVTPETFERLTLGKNVFLKFYESSCEHCQKLAPAWDVMAKAWTNHPIVLVGEVDCRADRATEDFCHDEMGILGLPTLLYGEPSYRGAFLQSYGDDKSQHALSTFVNETLSREVMCSPGNMKSCDPETKSQLVAFWKLSISQLESQIAAKEQSIDDAILNFKAEFDRMQRIYDDLSAQHESSKRTQKETIKVLRSLIAIKNRQTD